MVELLPDLHKNFGNLRHFSASQSSVHQLMILPAGPHDFVDHRQGFFGCGIFERSYFGIFAVLLQSIKASL